MTTRTYRMTLDVTVGPKGVIYERRGVPVVIKDIIDKNDKSWSEFWSQFIREYANGVEDLVTELTQYRNVVGTIKDAIDLKTRMNEIKRISTDVLERKK